IHHQVLVIIMAEEIIILKKRKSVLKGKMTRTKTFLQNLNAATTTTTVVGVRLDDLKTTFADWQQVMSDLEIQVKVDQQAEMANEREAQEELYFTMSAQLMDLCRK